MDFEQLAKYLKVYAEGGGDLSYQQQPSGVKTKDFSMDAGVEASIPIDKLIQEAMLRLSASGYAYDGGVKFPQEWQQYGAPPKIEYGDKVVDNLGVGFDKGGHSFDFNYNPETNSKHFNWKFRKTF